MKASRLLSIMMLLQARGRMTAPALAATFEVSVRTVLRDIDQLSAAGVPIFGDRGRTGGFQLREGWSTALTGLTEPEANALFLAGLPSAATEMGLGAAATSVRLKMLASLPPEWRAQADLAASRLHIDPVDWYRSHDTTPLLRAVAQAVWQGVRITVQYDSWRGCSERELEPLGLVLKAGVWYLVARVVGKPSPLSFRLSNILHLSASERQFKRPLRFDLAAHWQESTLRFEAELHRQTAHIAASPRGIAWLKNSRLNITPVIARVQPGTPAGWQEVLMPIESIEIGARQLLGYGAQVLVLAPAALRDSLEQELAAVNALYAV